MFERDLGRLAGASTTSSTKPAVPGSDTVAPPAASVTEAAARRAAPAAAPSVAPTPGSGANEWCCELAAAGGVCAEMTAVVDAALAGERAVLEAEVATLTALPPGELEALAVEGYPLAVDLLSGDVESDDAGVVAGGRCAPTGEEWCEGEPVLREGLRIPVDVLSVLEPGRELAAELDGLDLRTLDEYALVEVLAAARRIESWAASLTARAAATLSHAEVFDPRRFGSADPEAAAVPEEIAMRLGITASESKKLIAVGRGMEGMFSSTGSALARGQIDMAKATTIVTTLLGRPGPVAWFAEQAVLDHAGRRTRSQLSRDLAKAVIAVDGEDAVVAHRRATRNRHVTHPRVLPDGMASMYVVGAAQDLVGVDLVLDAVAAAARADGDTRTSDQLRADALFALTSGALESGWAGPPPTSAASPDGGDATGGPGAVTGDGSGSPARHCAEGGSSPPGDEDLPIPREPDFYDQRHRVPGDTDPPPEPADVVRPSGGGDSDRSRSAEDSSTSCAGSCGAAELGVLPQLLDMLRRRDGMRLGNCRTNRTEVRLTIPLSVALPPGPPTTASDPGAAPRSGDGAEDDGSWADPPESEVAELVGYGPITADVARAIAAGGTWRRIVTDPLSGAVLDVGRRRYKAPADLDTHVRERDKTCFRPGCSTPATRCELDHNRPWSQGGTTSAGNLGPACKRDHSMKSNGQAVVTQPSPGIFEWTTPTGHAYRRNVDGTVTHLPRRRPGSTDDIPF